MNILSEKIVKIFPKNKINIFGKEGLLHSTVPYYLLAVLMLSAINGATQVGYLFIVLIYTVLPLLDEFFELDLRNPTKEEAQ